MDSSVCVSGLMCVFVWDHMKINVNCYWNGKCQTVRRQTEVSFVESKPSAASLDFRSQKSLLQTHSRMFGYATIIEVISGGLFALLSPDFKIWRQTSSISRRSNEWMNALWIFASDL